jgi:hypothetical protein
MGGDDVGEARGQKGSRGGRPAQTHGRLTHGFLEPGVECPTWLVQLHGNSWQANYMTLPAPTMAKAPPYSSYKSPHSLHGENHIRDQVISFQLLPLPYM